MLDLSRVVARPASSSMSRLAYSAIVPERTLAIDRDFAITRHGIGRATRESADAVPGRAVETDYFLLLGAWPAGVLPDENGDGVAPPFLMFLSAFGFFFSFLLRICRLPMAIALALDDPFWRRDGNIFAA